MEVGLRVVRGPDWTLDDSESDGGEGFVGTVVEVGGRSSSLPADLVWVQWDSGIRRDHRAGYYGAYDLYVVDSAPIGVKHNGIECQSCKQTPILGMCWKCLDCAANFCLCTSCYMVDEHSKKHAFLRIDFPDEDGVQVGTRLGAKKVQSRGIFPGAKVVRGVDWRWNNQDGGEGKEGVVVELRNWKNSPKRGVLVSWDCAKKETYRLGARGKVDLKFVKPGTGGFYYKEHLPKMGEWKSKLRKKKTGGAELSTISCKSEKPSNNRPVVGDPVCVSLSSDIVKPMNEKFHEWTDEDDMYLGKVGTLHSVTSCGAPRIVYSDNKILTFHPDLVTKVENESSDRMRNSRCKFKEGTAVKITEDEELLRRLQQGHGPWNDSVCQSRGKNGKVLGITPLGDVEVIVRESGCDDNVIVFNADALSLVEGGNPPHSTGRSSNPSQRIEYKTEAGFDGDLLSRLLPAGDCGLGLVVSNAAGAGDANVVGNILDNSPHLVNYSSEGIHAPLTRACQGGHLEVAKMLLSRGAEVNQQDSQGYTALHHASNRDLSGVTASILVGFGANVNDTRNHASSSPLHLAVKEINPETIRVLLNAGCNVNLLDSQGFTALHHAAHWDTTGTTAPLLTNNGADLNNNHNGLQLTPLHIAAREYNPEVVEVLVKAGCHLNMQDSQGLTALHLSVRSDVSGTIASLLVGGGADVNANRNKGLLTPLHIAAIEENVETAHVLVQAGCDVNNQDLNGNTAVHEAVRRGQLQLAEVLLDVPSVTLTIRNREGLTAFSVAVIKQFRNIAKKILEKSPNVARIPGHGGLTALHFAALYNNLEILEDLLESDKVDIDAQNKDGLTALDLAKAAGKSSAVQILERRMGSSRSPVTGVYKSNQEAQSQEVSYLGNREACDFRFGDTVQVKENIQLVEPLQQGHGGWNPGMRRLLGKNGFVEEILHTGDVKLSVQQSGQQFAVPFIFNPSALVRVLSINDDAKTTSANTVDDLSSEAGNLSRPTTTLNVISTFSSEEGDAGESDTMDPLLEYALISCPLFDVQVDYCDIHEELNHQSASKALLMACKMRWFTKVKEILCRHPGAINRKEGNTFVLHVCCFDADLKIVKMLLEAGAELNTRDHNNFTPLHTAAMGDKSGDVTHLLLEKGVDPNDNDNTFCVTPLHLAVVRNNVSAAKTLAASSCTDFNLQNCEGDCPLHIATDMGREEIVAMLLRVDATASGLFNHEGHLPIHLASRKGYDRIIRMLVKYSKHDVNVLTRNPAAMAPIHLAVEYGHSEVINALLETNACDCRILNGAGRNLKELVDPTKYDDLAGLINEFLGQGEGENIKQLQFGKKGDKPQNDERKLNKGNKGSPENVSTETPLEGDFLSDEHLTVRDNPIETSEDPEGPDHEREDAEVGLSFEKRGDEIGLGDLITEGQLQVKGRIGETLEISKDKIAELLRAVLTADSGKLKTILTSWPQLLNRLFHGMTLLHLACCDGVLAILEKLLELGANLMAKDTNGLTPLQIAATRDKTGTAAGILLQNGADPDFQSSEAKGTSALHFAALFNNLVVAKQLIRNKCNVNIKDGRGNTPMDHAIDMDNDEIADLILESRAYDPMLRNAQGLNSCHKATVRGKKNLLKRLLLRSPNIVNEPTEDGDMALHLAASRGNQEIAKILMDEGNCVLDVRNRSEETPCKSALSNGHNDLARLLWGEHDGIELYEQLFAEMTQSEEPTDEQEQIGYELELSDTETSSVEGTVEPLDIHNRDNSLWRALSSRTTSTDHKDREDKIDHKTVQTSQATTSTRTEETKTGKRKLPKPPAKDKEIPDRLLCCICLDKQKNITFQCGHLNTCEECAQKVKECPECKATITSRLTTYY